MKLRGLLRRRWLVVSVVIALYLIVGTIVAYKTHDHILGMGDNSTFYSFARNISDGEVIYKDFIHFRTPGSYFLQALFIKVFGEQPSTVALAISFETIVLYGLCFILAIAILFWRSKFLYPLIILGSLCMLFIPPIVQLRAAIALLAVVVYAAFVLRDGSSSKKPLIAAGVLTGVTFIFGQETALMPAIMIVAAELIKRGVHIDTWKRIGYFVGAAIVGTLPLISYVLIWSNLGTFVYYVSYYALILQPRSMDLPFPELSRATIIYYLPFVLYGASFLALYLSRWKYRFVGGFILGFALLRLITLLGRSDWGHLIFAVSEMVFIVPVTVYLLININVNWRVLLKFAPYLAAFVVTCWLSIVSSSMFIILAALVVVWALRTEPSKQKVIKNDKFLPGVLLTIYILSALLMIFYTRTYVISNFYLIKEEVLQDDSKAYRIGGMKVDADTKKEIEGVKQAIGNRKHETIFSFPIQPFYYSLGEHHGARFMTFEPQTTVEEQQETIDDLKRTKPDIVIFDPLQAQALSKSVWEISDYLLENYQKIATVKSKNLLWIMVPRDTPVTDEKAIFTLYHDTQQTTDDVLGLQNEELNISNALLVRKTTRLDIRNDGIKKVTVSVVKSDKVGDPQSSCGVLTIQYRTSKQQEKICEGEGSKAVMIDQQKQPQTLILSPMDNKSVIWNEVTYTE